MAMSGSTIGEAKVMVSTPVKLPFRRMSSLTVLGEAVDVPPMNELSGPHMLVVPFVTAPSVSPEYVTPTPFSVPAAEPGAPTLALVQSVQTVMASAGGAKSAVTATRMIAAREKSLPIMLISFPFSVCYFFLQQSNKDNKQNSC
jgi:hypothetical protein